MKIQFKKTATVAVVSIIALTGCQTTREAAEPTGPVIYVKSDMSGETAVADFASCNAQAQNAKYERVQNHSTGGGLIGAITGAIVTGIINGNRRAEARRNARKSCLERRQYLKVEIPDDVAASYTSADTDKERAAILDTWIASPEYQPISAWFELERDGSAEAYRGYLDNYPEGDFRHAALISVRNLDGRGVELVDVRASSYLKGRFRRLDGLYSVGWARSGNNRQGPIDCFKRSSEAEIVLKVDNGTVSGFFKPENIRQTTITGTLSEDGTLAFRTKWPENDPVIFEGTYNNAGFFEGTIANLRKDACNQPVWFEVYPPAELDLARIANMKITDTFSQRQYPDPTSNPISGKGIIARP